MTDDSTTNCKSETRYILTESGREQELIGFIDQPVDEQNRSIDDH